MLSGVLVMVRFLGAVAVPLAIAGGVAWLWSTASLAGRAEAEIGALVAVNDANRAAVEKTEANRMELAKIARESRALAKARAERLATLEASLAAAEDAPAATGACPPGCLLPAVRWPWRMEKP